jgi:hypothetical protein
MNTKKFSQARPTAILICAFAALLLVRPGAHAQSVQHLSVPFPGGLPGTPVITGVQVASNSTTVTWDGPSGYYQLLQKTNMSDPVWHPVGGRTNLVRRQTIVGLTSNAFFSVSGPAPRYVGAQACVECHENIHTTEMDTRHASALATLKKINQHNNPDCLACHTVGFGLPTGFVSETQTPQLSGVQCENCHGPAGNHAANPDDFSVRPRIEIAGELCGGCHMGAEQPNFEEWKTSGHFQVVEDMNAANRIESCGRCHSGTSRLAQLKGYSGAALTNYVHGDANVGLTCVVCHDPHQRRVWQNVLNGTFTFRNKLTGQNIVITNNELGAVYTNQLRTAIASTNDFFLTTSEVFTNKYDPKVNACAQCHNHRGASWTSSSRPPHHSPQFNMLLGTVGEITNGVPNLPGTHSQLEKQCVACHMQTSPHVDGPPEVAEVTGHSFRVESYEACAKCHKDAATAKGLAELVSKGTSIYIQNVKAYLDFWASTKAPPELWTKYGTRAWEYTTPGSLSPGGSGPTSAEQAQIPDNIKKARFDLYLVLHDGSGGIHNPHYSYHLLDTATAWVQEELSK